MTESSPLLDAIQQRWIAGHLYYHQGLDPVLRGFVHPLVASLAREGRIDAFFFVRYALGGPHIRLRLRVVPGAREGVLRAMQESAVRFLELTPSAIALAEETIRRTNEAILAGDANEDDDSIYPDNTFRLAPFRPEVGRYGGPLLLQSSLAFFTLSSVAVLELDAEHGDAARSALLVCAMRLLLDQALGFAADETELIDLLRYGVDSWGAALPKVLEKGDKVASAQRDTFLEILHQGFAGVRSLLEGGDSSGGTSDLLVAGAGRLSATIGANDRAGRARIGGSQLHMTASRLGLTNAEEAYLSQLLTVTLAEERSTGRTDLAWLGETLRKPATATPDQALSDLLSPALAVLAEIPPRPVPDRAAG